MDAQEREAERHDETIVVFSGGEEHALKVGDEEVDFTVVRAILELLFDKGVISPDEFHRKLDALKRKQR